MPPSLHMSSHRWSYVDHDGEGVPDQFERLESFELVSLPSISAVNGGGGIDQVDAHAWWTNIAGRDRGSQHHRTLTHKCTVELAQGQKQEQERLLVDKLRDATSPQVQTEPLNGHL